MISSKIYPLLIMGVLLLFASSCSKNNDKDDSGSGSSTEVTFGSMTDQDNNTFKTVTIGTQTWMAENLKVTHYNDGTAIPNITGTSAWGNLYHSGAYCCYDNNNNYLSTYGLLYNWFAVNTGKLAPKGWHVPTDAEWTTLTDYLTNNGYGYGGSGDGIAKSLSSTSGWKTSSTAGRVGNDQSSNNKSGFAALPGGFRYCEGGFRQFNDDVTIINEGNWWSSSSSDGSHYRSITYNGLSVGIGNIDSRYGYSVRCIKDK